MRAWSSSKRAGSPRSLREVARAAGVSHQAPYHHFRDREAVLAAIAEQGFQLLRAALTEALAHERKESCPALRLASAGRAYVDFACAHPAHFRVMFRPDLVDLTRYPAARSAGDAAFSCMAELVREARDAGLSAVPSEQALIALCWSVGHGLACLLLDGPLARHGAESERAAQARDVMAAFASLVRASLPAAATALRGAPDEGVRCTARATRARAK